MKKVLSAGVVLLMSASFLTAHAQTEAPPQTGSEAVTEAKPKNARKAGVKTKTARTVATKPAGKKSSPIAQSDLNAGATKPQDAASYYEIGMGHYESKRFKDAVDAFQQSIRLGSTDPKTYFNLGKAYYSLNLYKDARESYKRAVKVKPDWDEAHYQLGRMYEILNDKESAQAQYKILLTLNPEMAASFQKLLNNDAKPASAPPVNAANTSAASIEPASASTTSSGTASDKDNTQATVPTAAAADQNQAASSTVDASSPATAAAPDNAVRLDDAGEMKPGVANSNTSVGSTSNNTGTSASSASAKPTDETTATEPVASNSEMPPTSVYRVGAGDVLDIRLLNTPTSRSTLFTVMNGGLIEYPLVGGSFTVGGLTTEEIGVRLSAELKRRGINDSSQVVVGVRDYTSHAVIVSGLVLYPGKKILQREAVPLYVLMAEAQLRPDAARAVIMRASEAIPINDLTDPMSLNALVKPGDVITVSARQLQYYFIGGRINSPGQKAYQPGLTLIQAILAAGGLSRPQDTVEISREEPDGRLITTKYVLKEIKSGKIPDPHLQPGDRIEVGH